MKDQTLKLYHQRAVEIWEQFCKLHHDLYELTCDEYQSLLSGQVESLEELILKKDKVVEEIGKCETKRASLIQELNSSTELSLDIKTVSDLLQTFNEVENSLTIPALHNLNSLLIDVITRIQSQNKRNQVYLNRAMQSLNELRDGFYGKKNYTTYGANGLTRSAPR